MRRISLLLLFVAMSLSIPSVARAEVWEHYRAETGMFGVDFPAEPEKTYNVMRVDENDLLYFEEMKLSEPIEENPSLQKHYIIRLDQTWGDRINLAFANNYLTLVETRYREHFEKVGGQIVSIEDRRWQGMRGKEMRVLLPVDGDTQIGIQARFFAHNRTKIQQMVIAPLEHLDNYRTSKFFASLELNPYDPEQAGAVYPDWKVTPLNQDGTISIIIPPTTPPYLAEEPKIVEQGALRKLSAVFFDPFHQEHMLFNAYLYDFGDTRIKQPTFDKFVLENHVGEPSSGRLEVNELQLREDMRGIEYWLNVNPIKGYDGIEQKYVKAYYVNNYHDHSYIVVLETLGTRRTLMTSALEDALVRSLNLELDALGIDPMKPIEVKTIEPERTITISP